MPRGLGLATATTSAAFFPHREQRRPCASSLSATDQPTSRARASGSISRQVPHLADHAHQELTKAIVQLLDVRERAHRRMVVTAGAAVHAVPGESRYWMRARQRLSRCAVSGCARSLEQPYRDAIYGRASRCQKRSVTSSAKMRAIVFVSFCSTALW